MATTYMRHILPVGGRFLGSHIYSASLHIESYSQRLTSMWGEIESTGRVIQTTMELELGYSPVMMGLLYDMRQCGLHLGYRDIGWGHVCRYCGTTYTTGVLTCPQCGGGTDLLGKAVERAQWAGWIAGIEESYSDAITVSLRLDPDFRFCCNEDSSLDLGAMLGDLGFVSQPKARLCPWCGALCDWGSHTCKFCGGNRLPEKELHNLVRECWHCGRETVGNYICDGCAVTLNFNGNAKVWPLGPEKEH